MHDEIQVLLPPNPSISIWIRTLISWVKRRDYNHIPITEHSTNYLFERLNDICFSHKDIIFGAQSSTVTNKIKPQHWDEIVATINQQFPSQHPRDREETNKKWNNLSSDARKNLKEHKNCVEQTGIILFQLCAI